MRLANNVTVNSYDTRPTAPGFRIFFQLKRASRKPFQIPCVFPMKVRLAFKVIVNLHVMRSIAPTFLVFFHRKCGSQESCRIPWVRFPCVFSSKMSLGFTSDCEFTCDAASCSLIPNTFPRKTRLAGGIPQGSHCHCKFSFIPSQESQILTKEHCTGDVGLFDSQFLTNRGSLLWEREMLGHVWLTILQSACHTKRLGCQRWHATECLLEAWMWWSAPNAETR